MLIQDIKPYTGFSAYYQKWVEPRRIELAEAMARRSGKTTKIKINDGSLERLQQIIAQDSDPAGDFSGASDDGEGR
jgi:hypothetical protein